MADSIQTPASKGRVDAFKQSGGLKKLHRLVKDAQRIASSQEPFEAKATEIMNLAGAISQTVTPFTPCVKRCNHCCYMAVAVSDFEADAIGRFIGRNKAEGVGTKLEEYVGSRMAGTVYEYTGNRCPMLGDQGECTVYPVRPVACRTHHNIAVDETNCVIVGRDRDKPMPTTPMINLDAFLMQHYRVFSERAFADIRDWFPDDPK